MSAVRPRVTFVGGVLKLVAGGPRGPKGDANVLSIGSVDTGDPGTDAIVTITGTTPEQVLHLTLPRGDVGEQGIQGVQGIQGLAGPIGLTWRGEWDSGTHYVVDDAVAWAGSAWFAIANNINSEPSEINANWDALTVRGQDGVDGQDGEDGPPTTITIGTVASGSPASATVTGAAPNQTLNLVIPPGAKGDRGDDGNDGNDGDTGPTGPPGLQPQGDYNLLFAYVANDLVTFGQSTWRAKADNTGVYPGSDDTVWELFAAAAMSDDGRVAMAKLFVAYSEAATAFTDVPGLGIASPFPLGAKIAVSAIGLMQITAPGGGGEKIAQLRFVRTVDGVDDLDIGPMALNTFNTRYLFPMYFEFDDEIVSLDQSYRLQSVNLSGGGTIVLYSAATGVIYNDKAGFRVKAELQ